MDLKTIRTLNLAGSVLFGIIGSFIPILYSGLFGFIFFISGEGFAAVCVIIIMAYMLYNKTVLGIDRGEYESAKTWMLAGAILGFIFAGGIITLILFLIGYITIDSALQPQYYHQSPFSGLLGPRQPYYYPPAPPPYYYGQPQPPPPPPPPPGYHYYHQYSAPPYYHQPPPPVPQKPMKDPEVKKVTTFPSGSRPETPRKKPKVQAVSPPKMKKVKER